MPASTRSDAAPAPRHLPHAPCRDERGSSVTGLAASVMVCLFLVAGLVVDGGAQVRAHRHAEVVAAHAVRQGTDASASHRLVGRNGHSAALTAARAALALDGIDGQAHMEGQTLRVVTRTRTPTTFLSLLGVDSLAATGSAAAELQRV